MILSKNKKYLLIFTLAFFLFFINKASAATLYIKPSQTEISVGNIVSVTVGVDTSGKAINNAESIIQFPPDLLEVVSVDNNLSIFSIWVEQPNFSNNVGQITFNGGIPSPGFQGSDGKIISIIFKTKKAGIASVIFSSSAVRENDGLGTDILNEKFGSNINIIHTDNVVQEAITGLPSKTSKTKLSIDSYPPKVKIGDIINIKGTSLYPDSYLLINVQKGELIENFKIKSDQDSKFEFNIPNIKDSGEYTIWAEILNYSGVKTISSPKIKVQGIKPVLTQIGSFTTGLLSMLIPALAMLILLMLMIYYGWYKFKFLRTMIKREVDDVESALHKAFNLLHKNVYEQIKTIENVKAVRALTKEEDKIMGQLKEILAKSEQNFGKEISDIKKILKK
jgi:hypothetical protein